MKRLLPFLAALLLFSAPQLQAQVPPQGIQFQAVARDLSGVPLANAAVTVRFNLEDGGGTLVYSEVHTPTTDQFGLFEVVLGNGTPGFGTFANIDWGSSQHQVQIDLDAGAGYVNLGTCQFETVPYAFVADRVDMDLGEIQNVDLTGLAPGETIVWNGTTWVPGIGSGLWSQNGADIYYNSGNVGIGDATPANTLSVGNGDKFQVSGTDGDLTFSDIQGSIFFPSVSIASPPMIHMFQGGFSNADRMVIAHSSTYPNFGLEYQDNIDAFNFTGGGTSALHIRLFGNRAIGIGTETPQAKLDIRHNGTTSSPQLSLFETVGSTTRLAFRNFTDANQWLIEALPSSSTPYLNIGHTASPNILRIRASDVGRVGINTVPGATLDVLGTGNPLAGSNYAVYSTITIAPGTYNPDGYAYYGILNDADFDRSYGLRTSVTNGNYNYGIYAYANFGSVVDYAGYFNGDVYAAGTYLPSDERLKKDIQPLNKALGMILDLKPRTYLYDRENLKGFYLPEGIQFGFLAQDLQQTIPGLTKFSHHPLDLPEGSEGNAEGVDFLAVNYTGLIPVLTAAMQEQQQIIDDQEQTIHQLDDQVQTLEAKLLALEQKMDALLDK